MIRDAHLDSGGPGVTRDDVINEARLDGKGPVIIHKDMIIVVQLGRKRSGVIREDMIHDAQRPGVIGDAIRRRIGYVTALRAEKTRRMDICIEGGAIKGN